MLLSYLNEDKIVYPSLPVKTPAGVVRTWSSVRPRPRMSAQARRVDRWARAREERAHPRVDLPSACCQSWPFPPCLGQASEPDKPGLAIPHSALLLLGPV